MLEELYNSTKAVPIKLKASDAQSLDIPKEEYLHHPAKFHFAFNEDQMAVEKLSEGIRGFAKAAVDLKSILTEKMGN